MVYYPDASADAHHGSAKFAGVAYFSGEIKDVGKGTIAFICKGYYGPETGAVCEWESDPQTGTGEFEGLKATGGILLRE